MTKKINTILFDLDGTLIDSNQLIVDSFRYTFKKYAPQRDFTENDLFEMIGPPLTETFKIVSKDPKIIREMINDYRFYYKNHEFDYVNLYPEVLQTLEYFHKNNFNLAIVTTKYGESALPAIKHFKLEDFIRNYSFLDNVTRHKPDPEPILYALNQFDNVEAAVMVGDNASDILAGKNAGILTCSVNWSIKKSSLDCLNPDFRIDRYSDLINLINKYNKERI